MGMDFSAGYRGARSYCVPVDLDDYRPTETRAAVVEVVCTGVGIHRFRYYHRNTWRRTAANKDRVGQCG